MVYRQSDAAWCFFVFFIQAIKHESANNDVTELN